MHKGANFKKSYLFQASYTEYSAISMIYGGHFEFWRPSWILKKVLEIEFISKEFMLMY